MIDVTAANEISDDARAWSNVRRLAAAQALTGANSAVIFATGSIIGATLAPDMSLATVPLSMYVVGLATGTLPTGAISRAYGRRVAFIIGTACGVATGLLGSYAILHASFVLFCCATFLGGLYGSVSQSYRFAAADGASVAYRPKAVSWVMAGGVFAGVLGPQLVQWTMDIWPPYLFAFSFVVQAVVALVAMAILSGVDAPKPAPADLHGGRPLLEIVRQPRFIAAAICGIVSYPMMNLVMTSAPLAMKICGLSVSDSNFGIQWHIVAMYGPSFFTGTLIARFGAPTVVAMGLVLEAAAATIGLTGITAMHFWATLIVLGIGWNFGFVGASALVLETHRPQERNKVQAFNDFLVFGTMAVGSFSSGQLLANYGWSAVNMVVYPPVFLGLVVLTLASFARRRRRLRVLPDFPEPSI
ncbi:MAG TPA: MFS transporter [Bradyrhizobium sp.]|jgi:MFS family permease|uniref:MFS transporter n=1 Tax=Bradyrhizobium sp. TaxID=376 RepID=UPI002D07EE0A|nr:MFS transporter [Bradyrhizobium sp.]HTA99494.1 MFS transporter [Bradyrhizobium sp.]